ncbi:hypothetical protein [Mucilaginibacter sp.]|uniref:hypothetical protein n=1 Tax=Mucilaginibacter sp. TaxID=1882438 RepID=UPI003B0058C3
MPWLIKVLCYYITLFGVAVLNGIMLIGYFNQLKEEAVDNIYKRVIEGWSCYL